MGHPAVGLFRPNLMPVGAHQVRAVHPIKATTASETMGIWVVLSSHKIRKVDQNATFGAPLLRCLNREESLWNCCFPIFQANGQVGPYWQEGPCNDGLT